MIIDQTYIMKEQQAYKRFNKDLAFLDGALQQQISPNFYPFWMTAVGLFVVFLSEGQGNKVSSKSLGLAATFLSMLSVLAGRLDQKDARAWHTMSTIGLVLATAMDVIPVHTDQPSTNHSFYPFPCHPLSMAFSLFTRALMVMHLRTRREPSSGLALLGFSCALLACIGGTSRAMEDDPEGQWLWGPMTQCVVLAAMLFERTIVYHAHRQLDQAFEKIKNPSYRPYIQEIVERHRWQEAFLSKEKKTEPSVPGLPSRDTTVKLGRVR